MKERTHHQPRKPKSLNIDAHCILQVLAFIIISFIVPTICVFRCPGLAVLLHVRFPSNLSELNRAPVDQSIIASIQKLSLLHEHQDEVPHLRGPFVAIATPWYISASRGTTDVKVNTSTLCVQLDSVGLVTCPSTNSVRTTIQLSTPLKNSNCWFSLVYRARLDGRRAKWSSSDRNDVLKPIHCIRNH